MATDSIILSLSKEINRFSRFDGLSVTTWFDKLTMISISLTLALSACTLRTIVARGMTDFMEQGVAVFDNEEDLLLAEQAMASSLKMLDTLLAQDSDNPRLLFLSTQGYGGYAFLFIEDTHPERARRLYLRAKNAGLRLLGKARLVPDKGPMDFSGWPARLATARKKDVPALFWTAYAWGGWINASREDPQALAEIPAVTALMERVRQLDPDYYYGGADLFLGSYYASRSKTLGGDPVKAQAYFEAASRHSGQRFWLTSVLKAQYYAVQVQDRKLFRQLLQEIASLPTSALPSPKLPNAVARQKAQRLLARIDELF